jgi:Tfp pilus assembly protein PilN
MSDLNLIPQEFRIEKEERTKRALYIVLAVAAILVLIVAACIPVYMTYLKNKENKDVEQDIQKLSYVTVELNKLNVQKASLQDKVSIVDNFTKLEVKWTGVINDLTALVPSDVSITNINIAKEGFTLQCTSLSQQAIAVFISNIEDSKKFTFDKIGSITQDEKDKTFKFNLSLKYNIEESKVK